MHLSPRWLWSLVIVVPLFAACGGGDDDDDAGDAGPFGSSGSSSDTKKDGKSEVKLPEIKAANYGSGKVHIEVSGDKDEKIDADGNGIAQDGFVLFTYAGDEAAVQISFANKSDGNFGGIFLTTSEVATGGEWGQDCQVTLEQADGKANGEFSCDAIDAIEPGKTKTNRVKLKGTFTAGP